MASQKTEPRRQSGAQQENKVRSSRTHVRVAPLRIARPVVVATAGRNEFAARCPQCHGCHRHISLGQKAAPCGARYVLEFKNSSKGGGVWESD